jgi:hypothetical protein
MRFTVNLPHKKRARTKNGIRGRGVHQLPIYKRRDFRQRSTMSSSSDLDDSKEIIVKSW